MVRIVNMAEQKKLMICLLFVALFSVFLMAGCGSEDKYVQTVRQGTMNMEPDVKIGKAFDNFFTEGKWKSFKSTDNRRVVEFRGKCTWKNKPAACTIQFIIMGDKQFELGAVSINDVNMNRLASQQIVDKALTSR